MTDAPKTVLDVLKAAAEYLSGKDVEQPRLVAELLLSRLFGCKRLELYLKYDQPVGPKRLEAMRRGIRRAAAGEPVQYILGETEFMGNVIAVDPRVLVPRPETEQLVERVLECDELWGRENPVVVDLGTGSGCIAISLALQRSGAVFLALDPQSDALALARENAERHGVADRVAFSDQDLADLVEPASLDGLVANLPYIPTEQLADLPAVVREHEPVAALNGGADGLDAIRTAVQDAAIALKPEGLLFLEIGEDQAERVQALLEQQGFSDVHVFRDLADRDRIVRARLPGPAPSENGPEHDEQSQDL